MMVMIIRRNRANNRPDPLHIAMHLTRAEKELALTEALGEFDRKAMWKLEKRSKGVFPGDLLKKMMIEDISREARRYRRNFTTTGSFAPQGSNRWVFFTGRQNAEHVRFCDSVGRAEYRIEVINKTWEEIAKARAKNRVVEVFDEDDIVQETEPLLRVQNNDKGKEEERELTDVTVGQDSEDASVSYQNSNFQI